jgi:1-acyl-sn-glycerol-3-phosphate acyltransferase
VAEPRFSSAALAAFELFFRPWMKRRIHDVHVAWPERPIPSAGPLLLAANHVSWWDGFILREVHRQLRPTEPFHVLMHERELRRFPFFRRLGGVGIDASSPRSVLGAIRALQRRAEHLPEVTLFVFPQGRIYPSTRSPLGFRRGVELIARAVGAAVVPVAIHLEPLNHPSPSAFVSLGSPIPAGAGASSRAIEQAVEAEVERIVSHLHGHGEDAAAAWPGFVGAQYSGTAAASSHPAPAP